MPSLLIANRGEIAIRIARAAQELGWRTVGLQASDEGHPLHAEHVDACVVLPGRGVPAYLSQAEVLAAAKAQGCTHVHPGYGLLSENAAFARACAEAGLVFVGPAPEVLDLLGDKAQARALAQRCGVSVTAGIDRATTVAEAQAFFRGLGEGGAMMIKALAGGGGRGMRVVHAFDDIAPLHATCQAEALAAFGQGEVYVEQLVARARHIEVQALGDGTGAVSHVWERDCTVQRNHQKLLEIAPAPHLDPAVRQRLLDAAVRLGQAVKLRGLCTFEFLVDMEQPGAFCFMEANPRLQVEHTITEQVTGLDLVQNQLRLAEGATLAELGLRQPDIPRPQGCALQVRVSTERQLPDGRAVPATGLVLAYEPPAGPGIRVDGCGHAGMQPHPGFDTLVAKVVVHHPQGFGACVARARRALAEFRLDGVAHNITLAQAILAHDEVSAYAVSTRWLQQALPTLLPQAELQPRPKPLPHLHTAAPGPGQAAALPEGCVAVSTTVPGSLVAWRVQPARWCARASAWR